MLVIKLPPFKEKNKVADNTNRLFTTEGKRPIHKEGEGTTTKEFASVNPPFEHDLNAHGAHNTI